MMRRVRGRLCAAASLGGMALLQAQNAAAQEQPPTAEVAEIIVTAQKRETVLQRTPETITALDGESLAETGAVGLGDLTATVPSLTFTSNFGISQIFIRGIGNNFYSPGGDPGVAFYNDGAYVSDQEATNIAFFDVARIEVLRGPQGALYGRNATGGAINVISAAPENAFSAHLGVVAGDYGRLESEGFVTGPLGQATSARLSYQLRRLDGFTDNELAGRPGAPDKFDDLRSEAVRLQTRTEFANGAELRLIGAFYNQDDNGPAEKVLPDPFPQPAELLFGVRPSGDERSLKSELGFNTREVGSVVAQLDLPVAANLFTAVLGYRDSRRAIAYDQDGTEANQSTTTIRTESEDFGADLRLASNSDGRFSWLVGANYVDFRQSRVTEVFDQIPLGFIAPGAPLNVPFPVNFSAGGEVRTRSAAVYGDARFELSERLTVSAGLRYTDDTKSAEEFVIFVAPQTASPERSWSAVSGKIGLDYQATEDLLIYGSVARGFKSGAINLGALTPPVEPETVNNLEVGLKARLWNRRGQFSAAAFTSDYQDLQVLQIGALSQILSNAAAATISGVEFEGQLKPTPALTLSGNFSYNDASYDEFVTEDVRRGLAVVDVSGNQLPLVSKSQAAVGAEYAFNIGSSLAGSLRADYVWRDRFFFTEFNTADAQQDAYGTLNVSGSLSPAQGRWRVRAFVRNLTDETAIGSMAIVSPLLGSVRLINLIPARHFGIGLEVNF